MLNNKNMLKILFSLFIFLSVYACKDSSIMTQTKTEKPLVLKHSKLDKSKFQCRTAKPGYPFGEPQLDDQVVLQDLPAPK
ncbi:hypothetical protein ACFL4A_00360 [bacterium]